MLTGLLFNWVGMIGLNECAIPDTTKECRLKITCVHPAYGMHHELIIIAD